MAGKKIRQLTDIGINITLDDYVAVLDVSEANPSEKNKRVKINNFADLINNAVYPFQTYEGIAGEAITARKVLMMTDGQLFLFDPTDVNNYGLCVGLSRNAAATGDTVLFAHFGIYKSTPFTNIVPNAIYFSNSDGVLTTVTPAEGVYQEVGFGVASDTIFLRIGQPRLVSEMDGDLSFDGEQPVKYVPEEGYIPGGSTLKEVFTNMFWPYLNATITLNSFPLQIVGSSYAPSVVGVITPKDDTITQRRVLIDGVSVNNPAGNNVNYAAPSFTVAFGNNKLYQIEADVSNDGSPITVESPERTVEGIYPYLWGSSDDPNLTGGALYTNLN